MTTYTTIPSTDVDQDSPVSVALMTALRDNPLAIAQWGTGAPKIYSAPYDYQEFLNGGGTTWTKPSNAESGDIVLVEMVAAGGAGARATGISQGGAGGAGYRHLITDIDDLASTVSVSVGAGGVAASGDGGDGGDTSFGSNGDSYYVIAGGGGGGIESTDDLPGGIVEFRNTSRVGPQNSQVGIFAGGLGGGRLGNIAGGSSSFGGGGGGSSVSTNGTQGGISAYAGNGGEGTDNNGSISSYQIDGQFPGGGGGAVHTGLSGDTVGGAGADGVIRVWCIRFAA